jgi:NTP pyrophosphatase (non-canonical NTP hydrolase)
LKLAGESGELADKIGKHWRNKVAELRKFGTEPEHELALAAMSAGSFTAEEKREIMKELGDVLWYVWAIAEELGFSLNDIAVTNIHKVADRKLRGVVCSAGDNR